MDAVLGQQTIADFHEDYQGVTMPSGWQYGRQHSSGSFDDFEWYELFGHDDGGFWTNSAGNSQTTAEQYAIKGSGYLVHNNYTYDICLIYTVTEAVTDGRITVDFTRPGARDWWLVVNGATVQTGNADSFSGNIDGALPAGAEIKLLFDVYHTASYNNVTLNQFSIVDLSATDPGEGDPGTGGGDPGDGSCCCPECLALLSSIAENTDDLETILGTIDGNISNLHDLAVVRNGLLSDQGTKLDAVSSTVDEINTKIGGLGADLNALLGVAGQQNAAIGTLNTSLGDFATQNHTDLTAIEAAILAGFDIPDNSAILQAIVDNTLPTAAAAASLVSIDDTTLTISETLDEFAARDTARDAILNQILTAINNQSGGEGGGDNSDVVAKLEEIKAALGDLAQIKTEVGTVSTTLSDFASQNHDDLTAIVTELEDFISPNLADLLVYQISIDSSLRNSVSGETAIGVLEDIRDATEERETQLDQVIALLQAGSGGGGSGDPTTTNNLLEQIRVNTQNTANTTATMLLDWSQVLNQIQSNTGSVSGYLHSIDTRLNSIDYDTGLMKTNDLTRNSHLNSIKSQGYTAEQQREAMIAKWDEETAKQQERAYTREGQLTGIKGELENISGKLTGTAESGPEVPYAPPIEDNTGLETEVNSWTKAYDWLASLNFTPTGQGSASEYTWFRFTFGTTLVTFKWPLELNDGLEWIGPIRIAIRTALTWLISISLYLKAFKVI